MSDTRVIGEQYQQGDPTECGWLVDDCVCESSATFATGVDVVGESAMILRMEVCETHIDDLRTDPEYEIRWLDTEVGHERVQT